ncbi:MAG: hypothetical protein H7255_14605 [Ramlibacter sp.]|nr:hypothetical protein [Ramlibacter sp.]
MLYPLVQPLVQPLVRGMVGMRPRAGIAAAPISRIGGAVGTTGASPPAHVGGDLLIVFAWNATNTATPAAPDGTWTPGAGAVFGTGCRGRVFFKFASGSSTTVAGFTSTTDLVVDVMRGSVSAVVANAGAADGDLNEGDNTQIYMPTLAPLTTSWQLIYVATKTTATIPTPTGMTARENTATTGRVAIFDTNGLDPNTITAVASGYIGALGSASAWITLPIELKN